MPRDPITAPPRVPALMAIGVVATIVAWLVIEFGAGIVLVAYVLAGSDELRVGSMLGLAARLALHGAVVVGGCALLRWLVRRWVVQRAA
jgi:hypothetical protein